MKEAIICDLDGTLYDARDRQRVHLLGEKKDFEGFHRAAKDDQPNFWCAQLIVAMRNHGFAIVFTSGRDDTYRAETENWISRHLGWKTTDYELHMRPARDYTADDILKEDWLLNRILPNYRVLFAIDDRKRVAEMWRRNGIVCLHCDKGEF